MQSNAKQTIFSIAFIILGFGLIFVLSNFLENRRPPLPENYADEDLALQGAKLKNYSLGFNGLIADLYWMQSLQYIGDKVLNSKENVNLENLTSLNPRLLYPLLDNAATLDPQFIVVYSYGAIVLPAIDKEQAIKITEKGIRENPTEWRLYQHLGYIYWRLENYEKAAEIYEQGARIKGAPPFMALLAARMKTQGGSRDTARAMYQELLAEAQDRQTKENAAVRLLELDWLDERDAIRPVLENFRLKNGRCPANWKEIFPLLQAVKLPNGKDFRVDKSNNLVDPGGIPYLLVNQNNRCDVILDPQNSKIPR